MDREAAEMRSGEFGDGAHIRDYRAELLGDILVERVIWAEGAGAERHGVRLAGPDFVWFRFWLPSLDQVIERYYDPEGELLGTDVVVCMPIACNSAGCRTRTLILDVWLDPDGRVTLHNEGAFEEAIRQGQISEPEAAHAEQKVRSLTASIAQTRFPPPLIRNWQIDHRRIRQNITSSGSPGAS